MRSSLVPLLLSGGTPAWAAGFDMWANYAKGQGNGYLRFPPGTDTHGQSIYAQNSLGGLVSYPANIPVITDLGLQTVPTRTNLFLNSFAVATQTVTVTAATTYTVSITGSGSITLSGAGTGTVTAGSPVTFAAGTTSLVCTVTGSPSTCNVEAGSFATPPILTTGSPATVNGNLQSVDLTGKLGGGVSGVAQFYNYANAGGYFNFSDGTTSNYINFYYSSGLQVDVVAATVAQASLGCGAISANSLVTLAFAVGTNFALARVVGNSAPTLDTSVTYPAMSLLKTSALGAVTNNGFKSMRKLAFRAGPVDQSVFDQAYAQAQLAAVS